MKKTTAITLGLIFLTGCSTPKVKQSDLTGISDIEGFLHKRLFNKTEYIAGESIYYYAYFTDMNQRYIEQPAHDAKGYCQLTGGNWKQLRANDQNLNIEKNSFRAQQQIQKAHRNKNLDEARAGSVALQRYSKAVTASKLKQVEHIISSSSKNGYLGVFNCSYPIKKDWAMSVTPTGFKPRDPRNQLTSHRLTLAIDFIK